MSTELDTEVRAMLEKRRGDWKRIAADAEVSHSWISQFVRGLIPNPGYATLKKLREYLVSRPEQRAETDAPELAEPTKAAA
jgi:transcriptional regulator with XRE-family HTH domain